MRTLLFVVSLFFTCAVHARVLHVGDNTIKLSSVKTTTPALHIKVDNEIWYGNMYPILSRDALHVQYMNIKYSVLQCKPFTDTTNYTYDENGRLIAANCNIYLESTGTQWIDTLYIPHNTSKFVTTVQLIGQINVSLFGTESTSTSSYDRVQAFVDLANGGLYCFRFPGGGYTIYCSNIFGQTKSTIIYDINNGTVHVNDWYRTYNFTMPEFTNTLVLYGQKYSTNQIRTLSESRFYNFLVYEEDTLVRHFVPVPCGLQIGDFVVPSNGMWDIVEQKFYGNMGSGDFIYGVDE